MIKHRKAVTDESGAMELLGVFLVMTMILIFLIIVTFALYLNYAHAAREVLRDAATYVLEKNLSTAYLTEYILHIDTENGCDETKLANDFADYVRKMLPAYGYVDNISVTISNNEVYLLNGNINYNAAPAIEVKGQLHLQSLLSPAFYSKFDIGEEYRSITTEFTVNASSFNLSADAS